MKVVVTGGAGFIGSHVVRALIARPEIDDVVVIDDLSTGREANLDGVGPCELRVATILDDDVVMDVLRGASSVVHLAARPSVPRSIADPIAAHTVNATGTLTVLDAARRSGVEHVVVASSSSVYGANRVLPKREDLPARPLSPYAASKAAAEAYTFAYGASYGLGALVFRFFNVFGPHQPAGHVYAAVIPAFVSAALDGTPLQVFGDGGQTRDFTYVETVADVLTDAVVRRVNSDEPVNLAFGTRLSLLELVECMEGILGTKVEREHLPARAGDVRDSQADTTLLRRHFPAARAVDFETGLRRTVEWFQRERLREEQATCQVQG